MKMFMGVMMVMMMLVMICRMMVVKMFVGVIMVTGWDNGDGESPMMMTMKMLVGLMMMMVTLQPAVASYFHPAAWAVKLPTETNFPIFNHPNNSHHIIITTIIIIVSINIVGMPHFTNLAVLFNIVQKRSYPCLKNLQRPMIMVELTKIVYQMLKAF